MPINSVVSGFLQDKIRVFLAALLVVVAALNPNVSYAHAKGENYVWINVEENYIDGRFEIRREDLNTKLGVDIDSIGDTRLEGLQASQSVIHEYLLSLIHI